LDSQRVRQIIESHGVIGVNYQDDPVWIEQINNDDTAQVTVLGTNERMEVPVTELTEDSPS
jgi:H-type small acid-soluble spore protein